MKRTAQKFLSLLLSSVVVLGAVPLRANAANVPVGDVNGDNRVNVGDTARLYAHFQGNLLVGQESMDRADLENLGWLNTDYVQRLYDRARNFTLAELLAAVEQLPENMAHVDTVTLKGRVVAIDVPYDPNFDNISVMLEVEGTGERILCHRMTGEGMEKVAVGDRIQVTGQLKNYDGWFQKDDSPARFAAGCLGEEITVWANPQRLLQMTVDHAYSLPVYVSLREEKILKGRVIAMEPAGTSNPSELTVTLQVVGREDRPVRCICMVGKDIQQVQVGKDISVQGTLRNFGSFVGFDQGCVLQEVGSSGFYG